MKLRLVQTCASCPEQYDAYMGDEMIGYLRLRNGHFTARYSGDIVYSAYTDGDGCFTEQERKIQLTKASNAIIKAYQDEKECENIELPYTTE